MSGRVLPMKSLIGFKCSDAEFVEGMRTGDREMQMRLYERCLRQFRKGTSAYSGLDSSEKDDIFQDSFILLWNKILSGGMSVRDGKVFVMRRNGLSEVPDLMGYFMRIVKNLSLERLREKGRLEGIESWRAAEADDAELCWDEDHALRRKMVVRRCVMGLPDRCREILTMFYYRNMSLEQILASRMENSSYDGLKTGKSKCMKILKARIVAAERDIFGKK